MLNRRGNLKALAAAAAMVSGSLVFAPQALAEDTIKVGVLHSLSGTMAISETVLKDTVLMAIEEINAHGWVFWKIGLDFVMRDAYQASFKSEALSYGGCFTGPVQRFFEFRWICELDRPNCFLVFLRTMNVSLDAITTRPCIRRRNAIACLLFEPHRITGIWWHAQPLWKTSIEHTVIA